MAKQLIFQNEARRRLKADPDKTAQAVAITLGPKGRDVALDQKQYQDMVMAAAGIIDPARVTRGALENAASIAAMILTIEVLVAGIRGG